MVKPSAMHLKHAWMDLLCSQCKTHCRNQALGNTAPVTLTHLLLEEFKKDEHRTEENFSAQCFAGKSSAAPTRGTVNASRLRSYLNSIKKRKCGKEGFKEALHLMQCSSNVGL